MALSNWDTLAINELGAATDGTFISPRGVRVAIYKNWLYLYDEVAWQEGGSYVRPCVMEIHSGELSYKDVSITALRGPQHGVYAIVTHSWSGNPEFRMMAGCGVSGYVYPATPCGHDANELGSMSTTGDDGKWHTYCEQCEQQIPEAEWVGVTAECVGHLKQMLLDLVPEYLEPEEREKTVHATMAKALETAVRFNQGDALFGQFGIDIPVSEPGQASPPIIEDLLGSFNALLTGSPSETVRQPK